MAATSHKSGQGSSSRTTLNDEPSTDSNQTLLTEHFGFHPRVFIDALVYAANEHMYSITGQFEEFAKKQLYSAHKRAVKRQREHDRQHSAADKPSSSGDLASSTALAKLTKTQIEAEAERGVHAVLTLMENALDHIFDLLELYCLKAVFGIRPSQATALTLKHHRGLDLRAPSERATTGDALTAEQEFEKCRRREIELRQRIESARRQGHVLRIANVAAESSLARAQRVSHAFAAVLDDGQTSTARLNSTTPQSARKIRADCESLVTALQKLIETDPLGASLTKNPAGEGPAQSSSERDRREVLDAIGASDKEKRLWERGREAYINWEMDRIIRNVRSGRASQAPNETILGADTTTRGHATSFLFDSPSKSMYTAASASTALANKRRRTTAARLSVAGDRTESEHQAAQIGQLAEVEELADLLSK